MQRKLKTNINPKRFTALLAVICALLSASIIFISDLMIIPFSAAYAGLLWFDSKKKLWSAILPVPMLALSFIGGYGVVFSVSIGFCIGLVLFLMYKSGVTRADAALALTACFVFFLIFSLYISVCLSTKNYSIAAAIEYYNTYLDMQKASFIEAFSSITVKDQAGNSLFPFTREAAEQMFLSFAKLIVAFFVIVAFFLSGLTLKIFTKLLSGASADASAIHSWRFSLPSLYAYFYVLLFIFSIFTGSTESIFAYAVANLSYIFMAVFAYIGLRHLFIVSSQTGRRNIWILMAIFGIMLFGATAIQILSFLGAYVTVLSNQALNSGKN